MEILVSKNGAISAGPELEPETLRFPGGCSKLINVQNLNICIYCINAVICVNLVKAKETVQAVKVEEYSVCDSTLTNSKELK